MRIRVLLIALCLVPVPQSIAAVMDQDLLLTATIGHIGSKVPQVYRDNLSLGDIVQGTITAHNVDDTIDGPQAAVTFSDFRMTLAGQSLDTMAGVGSQSAIVQNGVVTAVNFHTADVVYGGAAADNQFHSSGFWRILFAGWNLSDPQSDRFVIYGNYNSQLVPEPTAALLLCGGAGIACLHRRRQWGKL